MRVSGFLTILALTSAACASAQQQNDGCNSGTDDIRIAALGGLAQAEPSQVLPIMRTILARRDVCSVALRRQVVAMLARTRFGDQTEILQASAQADPSVDVRRSALQALAQTNSDQSLKALDAFINGSGDMDLRDAALRAVGQSSSPVARASLRRLIEQASQPLELRTHAVGYLSWRRNPDDVPYLIDLYSRADSPDLRDAIFRSVANERTPDATKWLLSITRDRGKDIEIRRQALSALGQALHGTDNSGGLDLAGLIGLYDEFKGQPEMQDRTIEVISQRSEMAATDKLLAIARSEQNPELRRKALVRVGQRRDPRVRELLLEVLSK